MLWELFCNDTSVFREKTELKNCIYYSNHCFQCECETVFYSWVLDVLRRLITTRKRDLSTIFTFAVWSKNLQFPSFQPSAWHNIRTMIIWTSSKRYFVKRHIPGSILSEFMEYIERKYELDAKDINRTIKDYVKIHKGTDGQKLDLFNSFRISV